MIGENNTPVQNVNLKYQKEKLNGIVIYAIKILSEKVKTDLANVQVCTMLPFNQLNTRDKLEKVINLFVTLREQCYSLKRIYENKLLELSYGTFKNYNSKYKKIAMI